jgi:hypothetical protein
MQACLPVSQDNHRVVSKRIVSSRRCRSTRIDAAFRVRSRITSPAVAAAWLIVLLTRCPVTWLTGDRSVYTVLLGELRGSNLQ